MSDAALTPPDENPQTGDLFSRTAGGVAQVTVSVESPTAGQMKASPERTRMTTSSMDADARRVVSVVRGRVNNAGGTIRQGSVQSALGFTDGVFGAAVAHAVKLGWLQHERVFLRITASGFLLTG